MIVKELAPVDPDAKIPAAIKAAAVAADELHKQLYGKNQPEGEQPPAEEQPPAPPAAEEHPPAEAPPEVTTQGNQEAPPPATKPAEVKSQDFEHMYRSMKGRYESDVRRLTDQIGNLQDLISSLQKPVQAAPPEPERLITPEDEENYGLEFLTTVGKKAKEVVSPELASLQKEIGELKQQLLGNAKERMLLTLDERLPEWRQLNDNQDFVAWLRLPDVYSGAIRHQLLNAAYERNDAPRVLAFFQGFLAEQAALTPAASRGPDPQAAPQNAAEKVPLETFAAPGRAKPAASPTIPAEKPIISRDQIQQFYREVNAGAYRGREKDKLAIEAQIFEAGKEGRIR